MRLDAPASVAAFLLALAAIAAPARSAPQQVNLLSYANGAWIVKHPREYDEKWSAFWLLDERSDTGWATPQNVVGPQEIVIELAQRSLVHALEFDTGAVDGDAQGTRSAGAIEVEVSDDSASAGFKSVAKVALEARKDHQRFDVPAPVPGRWLRVAVKGNHGSKEYIELFEIRALGEPLAEPRPLPSVTGTYHTNWGDFHMVQQGSTLLGCYNWSGGLVQNGGIENRVARFTWAQDNGHTGPAVFVFSPDGREFLGMWWPEGHAAERPGTWNGTRASAAAGSCPHWKGPDSARAQLAADLERGGKARIYGINFDVDSDVLRPDSTAALEGIARLAREHASWRFSIDGHTDATASAEHNQQLSERRAAAVKAWLVKSGIAADRLATRGFGSTKPIADNATAMGRAQNRRVELARD